VSGTQRPPGRLIVLEGADGVGKTTQAALLVERTRASGRSVLGLREPGGTPLGDELRALLLDPEADVAPAAEAMMFMAARAQLVRRVIQPALANGTLIVLDRFFLSTYAYQIAGHGLPEAAVRAANSVAVAGVVPDLTLLFEYPARDGLGRAEPATTAGDRMHALGAEYQARVAAAFAEYAQPEWQRQHPECGPIVAIDARGSIDVVAGRVAAAVGRWEGKGEAARRGK
jgi:dTMP kinase